MENSSHLIYGNITIINQFLKSKKTEFDILKLSIPINISNAFPKIQNIYKKIYCDIESGLYNRYEFIIYYLYQKLHNNKFYISHVNTKYVSIIMQLFSKSQLKTDENSILEIMQKIKISNISELFEINDGCNYAYRLVIKRIISPIFYLCHCKKYKYSKDDELIDDFIQFNKIINTIFLLLKLIKNEALL